MSRLIVPLFGALKLVRPLFRTENIFHYHGDGVLVVAVEHILHRITGSHHSCLREELVTEPVSLHSLNHVLEAL